MVNWILEKWRNLPIRWQGRIFVVLPLIALIISAITAIFGNMSRADIQTDVQRKFQMVSGLNEVLTLLVNAETGTRGYQLTKRTDFLQPYDLATEKLPSALQRVQTLVEAEPGEKPRIEKAARLDKIKVLANREMTDFAWQRENVNASSDELSQHLQYGKGLMDDIRAEINAMDSAEQILLNERIEEINNIRTRDYLVLFVTFIISLAMRVSAWYLLEIGLNKRIYNLINYLKDWNKRTNAPFSPSGKSDALGELEHEIAKFSESESGTAKMTIQKQSA